MVFLIDHSAKLILQFYGFRRYGRERRTLLHLTSSTLTAKDLETEHLYHQDQDTTKVTYWYRPGVGTSNPIIFAHGIGNGITPYLNFLRKLCSLKDKPSIFIVELPHVSMRMHFMAPTIPDTIREMETALVERGYKQAIWVGHSLGSTIVAGACRYSRKRVAGAVFLDPICFLLHHPDLVHTFVYEEPQSASSLFIRYFAGSELYTSRFISRQLHWYHSCLPIEDLPPNSKVFLAQNDVLVPSNKINYWFNRQQSDCKPVLMPLEHAEFLFRPNWENLILKTISEVAANRTTVVRKRSGTQRSTTTQRLPIHSR